MKLEISNEKLQEFNGLLQSLPISELPKVEKITQLINSCVVKKEDVNTLEENKPKKH